MKPKKHALCLLLACSAVLYAASNDITISSLNKADFQQSQDEIARLKTISTLDDNAKSQRDQLLEKSVQVARLNDECGHCNPLRVSPPPRERVKWRTMS